MIQNIVKSDSVAKYYGLFIKIIYICITGTSYCWHTCSLCINFSINPQWTDSRTATHLPIFCRVDSLVQCQHVSKFEQYITLTKYGDVCVCVPGPPSRLFPLHVVILLCFDCRWVGHTMCRDTRQVSSGNSLDSRESDCHCEWRCLRMCVCMCVWFLK